MTEPEQLRFFPRESRQPDWQREAVYRGDTELGFVDAHALDRRGAVQARVEWLICDARGYAPEPRSFDTRDEAVAALLRFTAGGAS